MCDQTTLDLTVGFCPALSGKNDKEFIDRIVSFNFNTLEHTKHLADLPDTNKAAIKTLAKQTTLKMDNPSEEDEKAVTNTIATLKQARASVEVVKRALMLNQHRIKMSKN